MPTNYNLDDLKTPIEVIFKQIVANKITMGDKGRMLFLYKNTNLTGTHRLKTYKNAIISLTDAVLEKYIKQLFNGGCKKVYCLEYNDEISDVVEVIDGLKTQFDWMCSVDSDAQTDIVAYAKANEKFCMTYNNQADSMFVVSHQNPNAVLINDDGTKSNLTAYQLIPILAGVACGCPYNRSVSYKLFTELESVGMPDEDNYILGQLCLYHEEEGIRLANACNTLQTLDSTHTEDMKSITIAEGMQRIKQDLIKAFRQGYKGKYKNHYDNQALFYSACNFGYIKELEKTGIEILDPNYDNKIYTDVETQRNAWLASGKSEAEDWDDETVKKNTYKQYIYATMDVKMLDAMEGMKITVEMF